MSTRLAAALLCACLLTGPLMGQPFAPEQPFASFWFPNDLLTWDPATDPDAIFNRSNVPLATRSADPLTQVNSHARAGEGGIASLAVMHPTTSNNPSQGARVAETYAFGYWPYVDVQVFFGGSAGEGLILAPNPGIIDAAHRHGVPIYGNIFFPPNAFGGNIQWVRDLAQRNGNTFPVGDKLIEVAEYYGFDGWFVNQETNGGDAALATDLRDLMRYVRANSDIEFQWYDAMLEAGPIVYQNALTTVNDAFLQEGMMPATSESMFLNYFWNVTRLINSAALATSLGRSPYELYAGVNVGINGFNTVVNWAGPFPEGQPHRVSLGLFAPNWTIQNAADLDEFYANENRLWVGPNGDPSDTASAFNWDGIAHYIPARTSITSLPFATHFNTGQGNVYMVDGERLGNQPWNNLGLQDVQPTWRWIVDSANPALVPSLDFDDAYNGGTSLRVTGDLLTSHRIDLFKTDLTIGPNTNLEVVYKTGSAGTPSNLEVGVGTVDGGSVPVTFFSTGDTTTAGWNRVVFDLSGLAGDTAALLALRFASGAPVNGYDIRIGKLALYDGTVDVPAPPSAVTVLSKDELDPGTATLRLQWTHSPDAVYAYHVYKRNPDGSRTHLGGTANNAYFAYFVQRVDGEDISTIEVEAIGPECGRSTVATTTFTWDVPLVFFDGFESGDTTAWSSTVP